MTNRFVLPLETPVDATGSPYPGGQLFFYASGTSTKLNTYSDEGLTIPNSNPVVLDSDGRFPNAIFLQNLPYKVVLAPADDTDPPTAPIWSQDPVYTSDYSTVAQFQSGSGSPNGHVAGNAGSATIPASAYWDYTNQILYVCTTTGDASTAVWTAINASTAAAVIPPPQGYLTPTSGTPVIASDVIGATAVYYTPYNGLVVPIYNGTSFVPISIVSELAYTLTSNLSANNIYDIYVFLNGGVPTLGSGPSWATGSGGSITAGSCARGTGASGSAISKLQGIWTNATSMTIRYGSSTSTATVAANQATYVGTIYIDGTNGQVTCHRSWGQNRKWGVWNAYNRQRIVLTGGDSTASWTYNTATIRASNNVPSSYSSTATNVGSGTTCNSIVTLCGLAEEEINATFIQTLRQQQSTGTVTVNQMQNLIGLNSITAASGSAGSLSIGVNTVGSVIQSTGVGRNIVLPKLGINNLMMLENGSGSTNWPSSFIGTEANMQLSVSYLG